MPFAAMFLGAVFVMAIFGAGCAGVDSSGGALGRGERADEPGSTRASRERAHESPRPGSAQEPAPVGPAPDEPAPPAAAPDEPAPELPVLTVHAVEASEGGDGRGATVPATNPVAFDLDATRFPPRALDPQLIVGQRRYVHYTYPSVGVLRFVAADVGELREGVVVAVEFAGDPDSRVVVSPALELP